MIKYYLNQREEEGTKASFWVLCQKELETISKEAKAEAKEEAELEAEEKEFKNEAERTKFIKDAVKEAEAPYKEEMKKFNSLMKGKDYILLPTSLNAIVKKVLGAEEEYRLLEEEFSKLTSLISADVSYRNSKLAFTKAVKESINDKKLLAKGFTEKEIKAMKADYKEEKKAVNVVKAKLPKKAKAKKEVKAEETKTEGTVEAPEME